MLKLVSAWLILIYYRVVLMKQHARYTGPGMLSTVVRVLLLVDGNALGMVTLQVSKFRRLLLVRRVIDLNRSFWLLKGLGLQLSHRVTSLLFHLIVRSIFRNVLIGSDLLLWKTLGIHIGPNWTLRRFPTKCLNIALFQLPYRVLGTNWCFVLFPLFQPVLEV